MSLSQMFVRSLSGRLLVIVGAGLLAACGAGSDRPAAAAPASPDVWAVVNGREIRQDEVERAYRTALADAATPSDEEVLSAKLAIVEELITQELLVVRAQADKLEVSDTDLENAFAERRKGVSDEEFQKRLTARSLSADDLKAAMRREMSAQRVIERDVVSKVSVSDAAVAAFYERNKAQFNVPETQYRLAQIAVTPTRDPALRNRLNDDAGTVEEARRKVDMILEKLRGGAEFASLAMDYSEDPQTVAQGGDLGFIPVSALAQSSPALREVVRRTQPGNVTAAMAGNAHLLVMVVSREDPGQRTLDSPGVRDNIRQVLQDRRTQILRDAYLTALRDDARIVNHLARQVVSAQGAPPPGIITTR